MAINSNTRFLGVDSSKVNLVEKKDGINNAKQEYFTIEEIGDAIGGGGLAPYKVFTGLLSQTGTANPTVTVLENTLGFNISFQRFGTGFYGASVASEELDRSKTFCLAGSYPVQSGSASDRDVRFFAAFDNDESIVDTFYFINTNQGNAADVVDLAPIEIRVYN